jgi:23S rRNA (uracil1939-C5)-methyltransferase
MSAAGTRPAAVAPRALVTALSHDGRGIARIRGKTLFIEDALPDEEVSYRLRRRRRDFDEAVTVEILSPSPQRVAPRCAQYGVCGGCVLQHLEPAAQVAAKQQALLDSLKRIGGMEPGDLLPPLLGSGWGYRRRARLSVHRSEDGKSMRVGFKERHRPYVTDTERCHVLDPKVGELTTPLAMLFQALSIAARIPQLEVAVGDATSVLSLRVLSLPSESDRARLMEFEDRHGVRFMLQPDAHGPAHSLREPAPRLHYGLPESGVDIDFDPTDFIQVNGEVNRKLVRLALEQLDPQPEDAVLDLFSGLGNFTLPLARRAAAVTGIEGERGLVLRARRNAEQNAITNASFEQADLFADEQPGAWARKQYVRILLDPPRAGAQEIIAGFPRFDAQTLVYVSCHPATLARDAKILVAEQGWRLVRAGVLDMFPHTAHVESIAVFTRS